MADIRINALATTAASTASDDFIAVDGSANGTRKLNAYSPTFGGNVAAIGNLTVSGAINVGGNVLGTSTGNDEWKILRGSDTNYSLLTFRDTAGNNEWVIGRRVDSVAGAGNFSFYSTSLGANALTLALISGNATLSGNLTVNGTGTSSFGGKIQSSAATATGYNQLYDTTGITTGRGAFGITSTGAGLALGIEASVGGTSFTGSTAYASYFGTTTATPIHFVTNAAISATLTSGGNFLIGTTTDAGGKLQIATGASNTLLIGNDATYTSYNQISLNGTRTNSGVLGIIGGASGDSQLYLLAPTGGALVFQVASATQFRVNSTGDATFGGFVGIVDGMTAPSATFGTAKIYVDTADGDLKVIFGDGTVKTIVTD